MRFLGDEDGDGLGLAVGRKPDLQVDAEFLAEVGQVLAECLLGRHHVGGVDVHRHPEDAFTDCLIEILDVDAALEQERRDFGDQPGIVLADHRYLGQLSGHGHHRRTSSFICRRFAARERKVFVFPQYRRPRAAAEMVGFRTYHSTIQWLAH